MRYFVISERLFFSGLAAPTKILFMLLSNRSVSKERTVDIQDVLGLLGVSKQVAISCFDELVTCRLLQVSKLDEHDYLLETNGCEPLFFSDTTEVLDVAFVLSVVWEDAARFLSRQLSTRGSCPGNLGILKIDRSKASRNAFKAEAEKLVSNFERKCKAEGYEVGAKWRRQAVKEAIDMLQAHVPLQIWMNEIEWAFSGNDDFWGSRGKVPIKNLGLLRKALPTFLAYQKRTKALPGNKNLVRPTGWR